MLSICRLMMMMVMMMDGQRQPWTDDGRTGRVTMRRSLDNGEDPYYWAERESSRREALQLTSPCFFCLREREKLFEGERDLVRASPAFYGTLVMSCGLSAGGARSRPELGAVWRDWQ